MKSTCVFLLHGCLIRFVIEWEVYANFVAASEHIAQRLGAEFLYADEEQL